MEEIPLIVDLLIETGLVPSKSAARRAIKDGGIYLNNQRVVSQDARPEKSDLLHGKYLVLRLGKHKVAGVKIII